MKTKTVVAAVTIVALASPAWAQGMPPINIMKNKPSQSVEDLEKERAAEKAHRSAIDQLPQRKADPWGNVRGADQKSTKSAPKN
jgi:hypothetical protein